jgi:hypothetical protein
MGKEFMIDLKTHLVRMMFPNIEDKRLNEIVASIKEETNLQLEIANAHMDSTNPPTPLNGMGNIQKDKSGQTR